MNNQYFYTKIDLKILKMSIKCFFLDLFEKSNDGSEEILLCVLSNGHVLKYPVSTQIVNQIFPVKDDILSNILMELKKSDVFNNNIVSWNQNNRIKSIGKFNPSKKFETRVELSRDKDKIIVYGMMHNNIDGFIGVYLLNNDNMELVFLESVLGVVDISFFNGEQNGYVCLPKSKESSVSTIIVPPNNCNFETRVIPSITFTSLKAKKLTRIISSPSDKRFLFVTWNDVENPSISFYRYNVKRSNVTCTEIEYKFMNSVYICSLCFNRSGDKVGFIYENEDYFGITIWDLSVQNICKGCAAKINKNDMGEILCSKFYGTYDDVGDSYYFLTTNGLFMYNKKKLYMWPQTSPIYTNFYINEANSIYIVHHQSAILTLVKSYKQLPVEEIEQPPILKCVIENSTLLLTGIHMYRCGNCRKPLIHPLVSTKDDIKYCYCSKKCQREHFPKYYTRKSSELSLSTAAHNRTSS